MTVVRLLAMLAMTAMLGWPLFVPDKMRADDDE